MRLPLPRNAGKRRRCLVHLALLAAASVETFTLGTSRPPGLHSTARSSHISRSASQKAASIEAIVKHPRLPVWPAWFGIVYIILDLITGKADLGAWLEDRLGGRVCPMIFKNAEESDPFLLVAHHRHSFGAFDPFRYIFRQLMPEGFPAHPHRGFETVTYVLRGGLVHRDSVGVKKSYGACGDSDGSGEDAAVQWMTTGRGILHEEMWRTGDTLESSDQELFQIWVNLPMAHKMVPPRMQMLGNAEKKGETEPVHKQPEVRELGPVLSASPSEGVTVRVVAGEAAGVKSPVETYSDLAILHVTLEPGTSWTWLRPQGWSCLVYARRGQVHLGGELLDVHRTATLSHSPHADEVRMSAFREGADLLILAGAPLREPVAMGANVIMNSNFELEQARQDLQAGLFGPDWSHTENDTSWKHIVSSHWQKLLGKSKA